MNVGFMTMNNLQLPKEQKTEDTSTQSRGLLSRGPKQQSVNKMGNEPRDRIASYLSLIHISEPTRPY